MAPKADYALLGELDMLVEAIMGRALQTPLIGEVIWQLTISQ